jgi:hypothetical protein
MRLAETDAPTLANAIARHDSRARATRSEAAHGRLLPPSPIKDPRRNELLHRRSIMRPTLRYNSGLLNGKNIGMLHQNGCTACEDRSAGLMCRRSTAGLRNLLLAERMGCGVDHRSQDNALLQWQQDFHTRMLRKCVDYEY